MADSQVEEIKNKIDIVSFINERVTLKKSGRNFKGLCPFHGEKTPSFFVSADMQFYKCFGCNAAGDVFNFLMQYEGLTFPEALTSLAERAGVTLVRRESTASESKRDRVLELIHLAGEYYHYLLTEHPIGRKALNYLKERGVSNQSIKDFKLGYAVDSWDAIQKFLIGKKGYTHEELESAGLIIPRIAESPSHRVAGFYDRFRGRIMFPLTTYAGKIVGFSGRVMDKEAKEAKYINSPETDYYHKSELLYGITQAKKAIRDKDRVVVVEGEFDVISSHAVGVKEVVAIKGSALTLEQASFIRRLTHNVILSLDADSAGQEAIKRGIAVCEQQALNLRVVEITGGKDPDEITKNNPSAWKKLITEAVSVYSFVIDSALSQHDPDTGEGKKLITQAVMPELAKIEHAVEREFYIKKLAEKIHVSETALSEELSKTKRLASLGSPKLPESPPKNFSRRELLERQLLGLALQSNKTFEIIQDIDGRWFSQTHLKRLFDALSSIAKKEVYGAKLINLLPEAVKPLAQEVYAMQLGWFNDSEDSIISLLIETKSKLKITWAKQHLVNLTKEMTKLQDDPVQLESLKSEYQATAKLTKEDEGGRNSSLTL